MKKIISLMLLMFFITISSNINITNAYNNTSYTQHSVLDRKLDKTLSKFYNKINIKYSDIDKRINFYRKVSTKLQKIKTSNIKKKHIINYLNVNLVNKVEELEKLQLKIVEEETQTVINNALKDLKEQELEKLIPEKNDVNYSFNTSKNNLARYVYNNRDIKRETIYCGCDYSLSQKVNPTNCGYKNDGRYEKRGLKIEWEHVVPAENFWQSFEEWRNPEKFPLCKTKSWKQYSGRACAGKVNKEYKRMEADMYNLYPAVGALNALRSNYQIAEISWEKRLFWTCDMEIDSRKMEPPENMKWDIARIYLYMDATYPWRGIISNKNKKLITSWSKKDPVSEEECNRYNAILKIQKNRNIILEKSCEEK